jgi:hypothetical protein
MALTISEKKTYKPKLSEVEACMNNNIAVHLKMHNPRLDAKEKSGAGRD